MHKSPKTTIEFLYRYTYRKNHLSLFGTLDEFERTLIREQTQASLTSARARGYHKVLDIEKHGLAVDLYQEKKMPVGKICKLIGISKTPRGS